MQTSARFGAVLAVCALFAVSVNAGIMVGGASERADFLTGLENPGVYGFETQPLGPTSNPMAFPFEGTSASLEAFGETSMEIASGTGGGLGPTEGLQYLEIIGSKGLHDVTVEFTFVPGVKYFGFDLIDALDGSTDLYVASVSSVWWGTDLDVEHVDSSEGGNGSVLFIGAKADGSLVEAGFSLKKMSITLKSYSFGSVFTKEAIGIDNLIVKTPGTPSPQPVIPEPSTVVALTAVGFVVLSQRRRLVALLRRS